MKYTVIFLKQGLVFLPNVVSTFTEKQMIFLVLFLEQILRYGSKEFIFHNFWSWWVITDM